MQSWRPERHAYSPYSQSACSDANPSFSNIYGSFRQLKWKHFSPNTTNAPFLTVRLGAELHFPSIRRARYPKRWCSDRSDCGRDQLPIAVFRFRAKQGTRMAAIASALQNKAHITPWVRSGGKFITKHLLNSMLFSFDGTKLQSPTFPFARPTANCSSPQLRYDGATQRMYWYLVSDASNVADVVYEMSKLISNRKQKFRKIYSQYKIRNLTTYSSTPGDLFLLYFSLDRDWFRSPMLGSDPSAVETSEFRREFRSFWLSQVHQTNFQAANKRMRVVLFIKLFPFNRAVKSPYVQIVTAILSNTCTVQMSNGDTSDWLCYCCLSMRFCFDFSVEFEGLNEFNDPTTATQRITESSLKPNDLFKCDVLFAR